MKLSKNHLQVRQQPRLFLFPGAALAPYVAHYTMMLESVRHPAGELALIPDASGCLVIKDTPSGVECFLWGPTSKLAYVESGARRRLLFFVEFKPFGLNAVMGIPAWELTDRMLPLWQVDAGLHKKIMELYEKSADSAGFVEGMEALLLKRLDGFFVPDPARALMYHLRPGSNVQSVKALCAKTFYSQRHLNRILDRILGMSAKNYLRLLRINQTIQLLQTGSGAFSKLAQEMGYYDQSHLIHDFKEICGVSPGVYLKNAAGFYQETYKF